MLCPKRHFIFQFLARSQRNSRLRVPVQAAPVCNKLGKPERIVRPQSLVSPPLPTNSLEFLGSSSADNPTFSDW
jgi:hypothetical protein